MSPKSPEPFSRWRVGRHLLLVLLLSFSLWVSYRATDFGEHWDENHMVKDAVAGSLTKGVLLPGWYNYPSFTYDLTVAVLVSKEITSRGLPIGYARGLLHHSFEHVVDANKVFKQKLLDRLNRPDHEFAFSMRHVCMALSLLSGVWVYLAMLAWRRSWPEAMAAASILLLSWEVSYHSRWIAPDGLAMQFAALTVALAMAARRQRPGWLLAAAVAAGLATGTKYTLALLLPALLVQQLLTRDLLGRVRWRRALGVTAIFLLTFVATTPALLVDPMQFWADVVYENQHYKESAQFFTAPHMVDPGWAHARAILTYLSTVAWSTSQALSVALFALSVGGAWLVVRTDRKATLWLVLLPLAYVLFFAQQRVMVARNLLLLLPMLAMLAGRAFGELLERARRAGPRLWLAVPVLLIVACVYNAAAIHRSSAELLRRRTYDALQGVARYLEEHPKSSVCLSGSLLKGVHDRFPALKPRAQAACSAATEVAIVRYRDVTYANRMLMNSPGQLGTLPGAPRPSNPSYYFPFEYDEVRVMPPAMAMQTGAIPAAP